MKKILLALTLMLAAVTVRAADSVFSVGYSTFAPAAVTVTSGTAVRINATAPTGFKSNVAFYRITNNHPTWDIYIGDINVSTDTVCSSCQPGHVVKAGGDFVDWPVNKDYQRSGVPLVPVYAKAADSSTVDRLPRLSIFWFGH